MTHDDCTCLVLYDWTGEFSFQSFMEWGIDFFSRTDSEPNLCSITDSNGKRMDGSLASISKRVWQPSPEWLSSLEMYHTLPDFEQLIFGWDVTAAIIVEEGLRTLWFCAGPNQPMQHFETLLARIAQSVHLTYGIGYSLPFSAGPTCYATGMVVDCDYTAASIAQADRVGSWFRERLGINRHLQGLLRDVYPLNVLSEKHLSQRVESATLREWVNRSSERGTLQELPGGATLWTVEPAHEAAVRQTLIQAGLLIAYLTDGA